MDCQRSHPMPQKKVIVRSHRCMAKSVGDQPPGTKAGKRKRETKQELNKWIEQKMGNMKLESKNSRAERKCTIPLKLEKKMHQYQKYRSENSTKFKTYTSGYDGVT